jgi:hypothetical protein
MISIITHIEAPERNELLNKIEKREHAVNMLAAIVN